MSGCLSCFEDRREVSYVIICLPKLHGGDRERVIDLDHLEGEIGAHQFSRDDRHINPRAVSHRALPFMSSHHRPRGSFARPHPLADSITGGRCVLRRSTRKSRRGQHIRSSSTTTFIVPDAYITRRSKLELWTHARSFWILSCNLRRMRSKCEQLSYARISWCLRNTMRSACSLVPLFL